MEGNIYINGLIGSIFGESGIELIDVITQVKKQPDATSFNVYINSEGGVTDVGFDIHNYLRSLGMPIKTIGSGLVASIATVIFMAGDQRVLRSGTQFMIHLPWGDVQGTADEIENYSKLVKDVEKKLIGFYTKTTGLTEDALRPLLMNETWLTEEQASTLGFVNLPNVPILAKAYFLNLNNNNQMTKEDKSWIEGLFNKVLNIGKKTVNVILTDANGVNLEFAEVPDGTEPQIGDKATVDGAPAEGEFLMPDGKGYTFVAGELMEIVDAQQDPNEDQAEMAQLKEQIATLTSEKETLAVQLGESTAKFKELQSEVVNLKRQITSRFNPEKKESKKEEQHKTNNRKLIKE